MNTRNDEEVSLRSQTTENDNWQGDTTKEILTNNQDEDKKCNSMKRLKGQQFLFSKTCIESER